jgi:single-stranded-DNA-specific exonuclease
VIAALVASGEPVLVACADARRRRGHLSGRLGGFALCSWLALERDPSLAAGRRHLVALDPPCAPEQAALARALSGVTVHLAWGAAEAAFAREVLARDCELRAPAAAVYRALRAGEPLATAVAAVRAPVAAGRALRALIELGLLELDRATGSARLVQAGATDLALAPAHQAAAARLEAGRAYLCAPSRAKATPDVVAAAA